MDSDSDSEEETEEDKNFIEACNKYDEINKDYFKDTRRYDNKGIYYHSLKDNDLNLAKRIIKDLALRYKLNEEKLLRFLLR